MQEMVLMGRKVGATPADYGKLAHDEHMFRQVLGVLRGKLTVSDPTCPWREEDGVIYFSVTPDGTTGEEWISRLESKGFRIGDQVKSMLRSDDFQPTNSRKPIEIAVLKGTLFADNERITEKIRAEADRRNLIRPNAEVACLIREKFPDEEIQAMRLYQILTMHKPIEVFGGASALLDVFRGYGGCRLFLSWLRFGNRWSRACGFVFVVPQASH